MGLPHPLFLLSRASRERGFGVFRFARLHLAVLRSGFDGRGEGRFKLLTVPRQKVVRLNLHRGPHLTRGAIEKCGNGRGGFFVCR